MGIFKARYLQEIWNFVTNEEKEHAKAEGHLVKPVPIDRKRSREKK